MWRIFGLSVERFLKFKHPNIDTLMRDGILSLNTQAIMPSVTLPNWTDHLTSGGQNNMAYQLISKQ